MGTVESNTPYDDVCRTMVVECDDLVIPLINEMFGEHFRPGDRILRLANEHFIEQQGGAEEKRITDGLVSVFDQKENREKRYHIECESGKGSNGTVLIRIFEYAAQIALDDGKVLEDTLKVEFPRSAVIFLRKKNEAAKKLMVCLNTPGGEVSYEVPALFIHDYEIEDIFEKHLYFLIPFYLFKMESNLSVINEDAEKLEKLEGIYSGILAGLETAEKDGVISYFSYLAIRDMTNKVAGNLAGKYDKVKKGLGDLMGGQVLDFEAKRIRDESRLEGIREGKIEGIREGKIEGIREGKLEGIQSGRNEILTEVRYSLINKVCRKVKKGNKPKEIAEMLEEDEETVEEIYNVAKKYAPVYDKDKIYNELYPLMVVREETNYGNKEL